MLVAAIVLACGTAFMGCRDQEPTSVTAPRLDLGPPHDSGLSPIGDTYVLSGSTNANRGGAELLVFVSGETRRTLVQFDTAQIYGAIGHDSLISARIDFTIYGTPSGWDGGYLDLFRMTHSWTELGATWNCSVDANTSNSQADCSGATAWSMSGGGKPYLSTVAASSGIIQNNQSGLVSFDVTSEIRALQAGTTLHYGWLVAKHSETGSAAVSFFSRDGTTKPRLVLTIASDTTTPPIPAQFTDPRDSTKAGLYPGTTQGLYYRHILDVLFSPSATGAQVRAVIGKYHASILGGWLTIRAYTIQIPDPGTITAADSIRALIRSEPGVAGARLTPYQDIPLTPTARYPHGAPSLGADRSSWFGGGTSYTQPFLKIRAPLAWGCETGNYANSSLKVGVADFFFDTSLPAFQGRPIVDVPLAANVTAAKPAGNLTLNHGTAVAGILAGRGDNDSGVAGMFWGGTLYLYEMGRAQNVPANNLAALDAIIKHADSDGVRILNLSFADYKQSWKEDSLEQDYLQTMIKAYTEWGAGNLLVVSAANDTSSYTKSQWATGQVRNHNTLATAAAQLADVTSGGHHVGDRILWVSGTDGSALWYASDYIQDVSVVAAPAANLGVLQHSQYSAAPHFATMSGTSLAAPMVAGAAALLWSFDSTLAPEQVKTRLSTGQIILSNGAYGQRPQISVPGFTYVYQLDAYSPLAIHASDTQGLPVCGFPVQLGSDGHSVLLQRYSTNPETVEFSSGYTGGQVSVAQGGRRIAVGGPSSGTEIRDQHQNVLGTSGGWVEYLERDTSFVTASSGVLTFTLKGPSFSSPVSLTPYQGINNLTEYASTSPAGDTIAIGAAYPTVGCVVQYEENLVSVLTGSRSVVHSYTGDGCNDITESPSATPAWQHNGKGVVFSLLFADVPAGTGGITLDSYSSGGQLRSSSATLLTSGGGAVYLNAWFSPDDSLVATDSLLVDSNGQTISCNAAWKNGVTLATVALGNSCLTSSPVTVIPEAPGVGATTAVPGFGTEVGFRRPFLALIRWRRPIRRTFN